MNESKSGKIIWAIDPSPDDKNLQLKTAQTVARLAKRTGAAVEPVSVLSAERLKIPASAFKEDSAKADVAKTLESWLKAVKIPNLASPVLLTHGIHADTNAVAKLLKYSKDSGASFIVLGTHTRKKWERLFLGSFAESLILKSDVPVLVVNPRNPVRPKFSNVFFATDFSESSLAAYEQVLSFAKSLGAKVTLYYKFEYMVPETIKLLKAGADYRRYLETDRANKKQTAGQWVENAAKVGVKAKFILDEKPSFVADGIVKEAKKSKADIIAIVSTSGMLASYLLGSVARQVVRTSPVPVWVTHSFNQ